jgi:hypothetical protein
VVQDGEKITAALVQRKVDEFKASSQVIQIWTMIAELPGNRLPPSRARVSGLLAFFRK